MIDHKKKLIFLHIPKTSGKSVETYLVGKTIGNPHATDWRIKEELAKGEYKNYFSFGIIRNPTDRIISVYNHYKNGGMGIAHDKNVQSVLKSVNFDEFVDQIDEYKGSLISEYMLGPQYRWFFEGDQQIVSRILLFDRLPHNVMEIGERYGITDGFPWINKSKKFVDLEKVNTDTLRTISRKYKKDFDIITQISKCDE